MNLSERIDGLAQAWDSVAGPEEQNALIREDLFLRYVYILSHEEFSSLPPARRLQAMLIMRDQLAEAGSKEAPMVGLQMARVFREGLENESYSLKDQCAIYDILYGLFRLAAASLLEMERFDFQVVAPFRAYLEKTTSPLAARALSKDGVVRVCYLAHYAHFLHCNAISPILMSLIKEHAKVPRCEVHVYCVQWFDDEFVKAFDGTGVKVRTFDTAHDESQFDVLQGAFAEDGIDIALTDINSSLATWLFASRVAPLQTWVEMGYPYWSTGDLDWVFLCHKNYREDFGVDPERCGPLRLGQEEATILKPFCPEEVAEVRASLPSGAVLLGALGRLAKVTEDYLKMAEQILVSDEHAFFLLAGGGDPSLILRFLESSSVADRFVFHQRSVDMNVYGRALDIFVDTFPFPGGNACREVMVFGTPVVSVRSEDWPRLHEESRDKELVLEDAGSCAEAVLRLVADPVLREAKGRLAQKIAAVECSAASTVFAIHQQLGALWDAKTAAIPAAASTN